jgi:hypothetical protein
MQVMTLSKSILEKLPDLTSKIFDQYCVGVFFDLKKAFDVCSHEILLMKLSKMGISGIALDWFRSYLSERSQIVDINGNLSRLKKIKISILQGSILGWAPFYSYVLSMTYTE